MLSRAPPGDARCGVVVAARSKKVVRHRARQAWRRTSESTIDAVLNHKQSASRSGVLGVYNRSTRLQAQDCSARALGATGRGCARGTLSGGGGSDFARAARESVIIFDGLRRGMRFLGAGLLPPVEGNSTDGNLKSYIIQRQSSFVARAISVGRRRGAGRARSARASSSGPRVAA